MAFEPLSWALSFGLGKAGDKIIKCLTPSELSVRLDATVRDWASSLPSERWAHPAAIFSENDPEPGLAGMALFQQLLDSKLPTVQQWHAALLERWQTISTAPGEHQPFFALSQSEAADHLSRLSERLVTVCRSDEKMYRESMLGLADRVEAWRTALDGAQDGQDAKLHVRDVVAPERWNANYKISFHVFYGGRSVVLIDRLRMQVVSVLPVHQHAVKTPGAPATEYCFSTHLEPLVGNYEMASQGARRFMLSAGRDGRTELLQLDVTAKPGWAYLAKILATQINLEQNESTDIATPDFWLTFEA